MSITMKEMSMVKAVILSRLSNSLDEIIKTEISQSGMNKETSVTLTEITNTMLTELSFRLSDLIDENNEVAPTS